VDKLREADTVVDALGKAMLDGKAGLSSVPGLVLRVIKEELWRERVVVRTGELVRFENFTDFVTTPPLEGLGTDIKMLRRICQDDMEALSMLDEVSQRGPGANEGDVRNPAGRNQHTEQDERINRNNVTFNPQRDYTAENERRGAVGNSREAALRRLRKDRPDLHEQVLSGELTPHEAMLEAGFRKPTATIRLDDMAALVETLKKRLSPEQIDEIKSLL
jgi:hypothetical protein